MAVDRPASGSELGQLRDQLRAQRRAVPPPDAARAAHDAAARAITLLGGSDVVALYLADDGELDPGPLGTELRRRDTTTAYPVIGGPEHPSAMTFRAWDGASPLERGRFGISAPTADPSRPLGLAPTDLDAVVVPLVAFDAVGGRLGRGAGFYDRAFAFRRAGRSAPTLIGYAYDFQRVPTMPRQPWDVPLDAVVTPSAVLRW